jgi:hypothetical protein
MPDFEYGQALQRLSTWHTHPISEAFIYPLFIACSWIIHLNESMRNLNAPQRDRFPVARALNCMRNSTTPRMHRSGTTCNQHERLRKQTIDDDALDADEPLNAYRRNPQECRRNARHPS